jgi:hypothetical protein
MAQILFGFAFYPSGAVSIDGEVISGVQHSDLLAGQGLVLKLDGWGLVVILEAVGVVFHHVYFRKLDSMALELNGHPHLPTRITPTHVPMTAANASCGIGGSYLTNYRLRLIRYVKPLKPVLEFGIGEHPPPL